MNRRRAQWAGPKTEICLRIVKLYDSLVKGAPWSDEAFTDPLCVIEGLENESRLNNSVTHSLKSINTDIKIGDTGLYLLGIGLILEYAVLLTTSVCVWCVQGMIVSLDNVPVG